MKKYLLSSLLFVAACSGGSEGGVMEQIMASWKGASASDAIQQWGYPDAERSVAGRTLLIWNDDQQMLMPQTSSTVGNVSVFGNQSFVNATTTSSGGGVMDFNCTRFLEIDSNQTVVGADWKGNNCPFMEIGPYANWRRAGT